MKPRSAKAKGSRLEKAIMDAFNRIGWQARKQPGSGIYQSFPHDVFASHDEFGDLTIECKSWKSGWRTGDKAMGQADMLVIKRDYGEPCVYMTWRTFAQLVGSEPIENAPAIVSAGFRKDMRRKVNGTVERK